MPGRKARDVENEFESRDDQSRPEVWSPPTLLEAPPARPGMEQRWVSTSILGKDVPHHTMKRFREGWVPRAADTVPEDFPVPTITHGQFVGAIGIEGMILCEMPEEKISARKRYFRQKTKDLELFVDSSLGKTEREGGIPIDRIRRSEVTRGRIADD